MANPSKDQQMQLCPTCKGRGMVRRPKQRVKNGKTTTEYADEACPQCGWSGWVRR